MPPRAIHVMEPKANLLCLALSTSNLALGKTNKIETIHAISGSRIVLASTKSLHLQANYPQFYRGLVSK